MEKKQTWISAHDAALQGLARTLWEEWMHVSASLSAHDIADVPRAKTESPSDVGKRHALPTQRHDELVSRRVLWMAVAWIDEPHATSPQDAANEVRSHAVNVTELIDAGAASECRIDGAITLRDFAVGLAAHGLGACCCCGFGGVGKTRCACFDHRFERYLVVREIANGDLEFVGYAVIGHLADAANRNAEVRGQRCVSPSLFIKPIFEIHGESLAMTKPNVKLKLNRLSLSFPKHE